MGLGSGCFTEMTSLWLGHWVNSFSRLNGKLALQLFAKFGEICPPLFQKSRNTFAAFCTTLRFRHCHCLKIKLICQRVGPRRQVQPLGRRNRLGADLVDPLTNILRQRLGLTWCRQPDDNPKLGQTIHRNFVAEHYDFIRQLPW